VGTRGVFAAGLAALAILLSAVGAAAATDLNALLAGPPGADWIDVDASLDNVVGEFTAHSFAGYLKANGTSPGATEFDLNLFGFTRGFGREWEQRGTHDVLIERVFEFRAPQGARSWYSVLKRADKTASEHTRDIPTPSIPNSSASAFKYSDGELEDSVNFWKGNLAFVVDMYSSAIDLSPFAVAQASNEYANAPSQTEVPPGTGRAVNDWLRSAGIVAGVVVMALALTTAITILLLTRRQRQAALPGAQPVISSDGAYWWDGRAWRPMPRPPT